MDNIFNIKRFGYLLNKDFQENYKRYTIYFFTLLGIIAIILTWVSLDDYLNNRRFNLQMHNIELLRMASLIFAIGGLQFASTIMSPMDNKTKRIAYLITPASNFEKYLSRWLIVTIGYIIAFFIALWLADLLRVLICSFRFPDMEVKQLDFRALVCPDDSWSNNYVFPNRYFLGIVATIYSLIQSIFVLGSLFWGKNSFVKTFSVSVIIIALFILICRWTILIFYGRIRGFENMLGSFEPDKRFTSEQAMLIAIIIISLFAITNWVLAYFRMKESEIIKRW